MRRDDIEKIIIDPLTARLRDPELVKQMAAEIERNYAAHLRESAAHAEIAPQELIELEARILRLRGRLENGDHPDMSRDEVEAALGIAEQKRRELQTAQPRARREARIVTLLPKAASMYVKQIDAGLDGNPREASKARAVLRQMLGPITLTPHRDGSLWASYKLSAAAVLVRAANCGGRGSRI